MGSRWKKNKLARELFSKREENSYDGIIKIIVIIILILYFLFI